MLRRDGGPGIRRPRRRAGALYNTLDRLEEKGIVASQIGDAGSRRPERPFVVTKSGVEAVARAQRAYQRLLRRWLSRC